MFVAAQPDPRINIVLGLMDRLRLSKRWLAEQLETSHTNINTWLDPAGSVPRGRDAYAEMIKALKSEGVVRGFRDLEPQSERMIPVYASIMAGKPASYDMDLDYEPFPYASPDRNAWGRIVDGYSMADLFLPGDIAVFDDRAWDTGNVCHVFNDATDLIKAVKRLSTGHFQLLSYNEDYAPIEGDDWKVNGVCIGRIRYLERRIRQVTEFPHALSWADRHMKI